MRPRRALLASNTPSTGARMTRIARFRPRPARAFKLPRLLTRTLHVTSGSCSSSSSSKISSRLFHQHEAFCKLDLSAPKKCSGNAFTAREISSFFPFTASSSIIQLTTAFRVARVETCCTARLRLLLPSRGVFTSNTASTALAQPPHQHNCRLLPLVEQNLPWWFSNVDSSSSRSPALLNSPN